MDRAWMIERLQQHVALVDETLALGNPFRAEKKAIRARIDEADQVVRQIVDAAQPGLGNYSRSAIAYPSNSKQAALAAIGILREQEELKTRLTPDSPLIAANSLHPWIWDAAATFWESKHYAQAVEQGRKSLNAYLQDKTGRRDVSDDNLVNQTLSPGEPQSGQPRLRAAGDRTSPTWPSKQRGLHTLGQACAAGIRNIVVHDYEIDIQPQLALEYLATLSVLARWIADAELVSTVEGSEQSNTQN